MGRAVATIDGNEAVASVAHRLNEVIAIYPITPSSPMGEWADQWAAEGQPNIWGTVPSVVEMQSEGGAAGAVHGALQTGALTTTFTASQGLLLMIPNMYKIAGELTPTVFHVAARSLAAQGAVDLRRPQRRDGGARHRLRDAVLGVGAGGDGLRVIAQAATLESRIPFLHFFDGFRTSHEVAEDRAALRRRSARADRRHAACSQHRSRGAVAGSSRAARHGAESRRVLPGARDGEPVLRRLSRHYAEGDGCSSPQLVGRAYRLFEYHGAPDAERVIVLMGSGAEAVHETVDALNARGEKVGVLKVRLYRPFDVRRFVEALPATTKALAVLDRTKEPGSAGEPLYLDCVNAIHEGISNGWGDARGVSQADRRALRAVVEGIHAGDDQGGVRQSPQLSGRRITSPSASTTTSRTPASTTIPSSPIEPDSVVRACSTVSGPTAPSAPTRTRSRSSAKTRPLRAGLLRLRLEEGRRGDRVAPALRPRADSLDLPDHAAPTSSAAISAVFLERYDMLQEPRAGRDVPAEQRLRPGRRVGAAAAQRAGADHRQAAQVLRASTPTRWRATAAWAGASTRSCRSASSPSPACCRRTRRSRRSRNRSRRPTARRAKRSCG